MARASAVPTVMTVSTPTEETEAVLEPAPISVLIVDDQDLVRSGVAMIVDSEPDLTVAGQASDGRTAIDVAHELRPDVVLMDILMPGSVDGIEATRRIVAETESKVVMLATFDSEECVFPALQAGASAYLLKASDGETLVHAVRTVHDGRALMSPEVTRTVLRHFTSRATGGTFQPQLVGCLSERERDVLSLVARGLSNAEIAEELVVSEYTAKSHVSHILSKTGVRDRVQAVSLAYESGLVRPGEGG
ncbi:two component transcriptional regulator, LuxR family [Actinopolyspora xinjiangensis]|uniref:Two component transcriptional regulator, LuxR family n=1 Tax=Actinopolyspora xinjiangensis TaxID=405564 RepID=A0A1H0V8K4_9ACTN|nr:response regulator transcription factor [Actinopolyspora xinjiangensis]SDP74872.1 two component transcriptional regulator, LuxR family [Actinopolyspora xinjiangensis]